MLYAWAICLCSLLIPIHGHSQVIRNGNYDPEDSIQITKKVNALVRSSGTYVERAVKADEVIEESIEAGFLRGLLNGYNQKGLALWGLGRFSEARDYFSMALPLADSVASKMGKAMVLENWGSVERFLGNYPEALDLHLAARELFEELGEPFGLASSYNNTAIIYKFMEDDSTALINYRKSMALSEEIGRVKGYVGSAVNMIIIFQENMQLDSARYYLDKIFSIDKESVPLVRLGQAYSALATNYSIQGKYDSALISIQEAKSYSKAIDDVYLELTLNIKEGNIRGRLGQKERARKLLGNTVERAREMNAPEALKSATAVLMDMDVEEGDFEAAFKRLKLQQAITDSLLGEGEQMRIGELRGLYEVEKKEKELAEVNLALSQETETRQQKELDLAKSQNRIILLVAVALALLLVVGFIAIRLRENSRRSRLLKEKQELTERSLREKEVLVAEVHHRVKNNLQVIYNILDLQSRTLDPGEGRDALRGSMLRISSMALVHNELYRQDDLSGVNMEEYLYRLVENIQVGFVGTVGPVEAEVGVTPGLVLDLDSAIPIGMLANEVITNSLKHAFPEGKGGKLTVSLLHKGEELELKIADNGQGKSDGSGSGGFGSRLIRSLTRQLKGELKEVNQEGTETRILIRKFKAVKV